jgi:hypothetical protein
MKPSVDRFVPHKTTFSSRIAQMAIGQGTLNLPEF